VYLYGPLVVVIGANNIMIVWAGIRFCQRSVESSQVTNVSRTNQRYYLIACKLYSQLQSNRKCVAQIEGLK
jgi:hypothetical protein